MAAALESGAMVRKGTPVVITLAPVSEDASCPKLFPVNTIIKTENAKNLNDLIMI
jgi:hypothetical protein